MPKIPHNAPQDCPGPSSEQAGKADTCEGCPNQAACQAGPSGPDPALVQIRERMSTVKRKFLVLSGKGGVGKSTVATQLAFTLASQGYQVGLLDVDICGPSIPKMVGLENEEVRQTSTGWTPVYRGDNLAVMSIGFLLQREDQAIIWRGPRKNGLIKQFLRDVAWSELDVLIVDTPPGTSDEHLSIVTYLSEVGVDGCVVVTTPQEVALLDVRKEIAFCRKVGLPLLGVVENMTEFVCPRGKTTSVIFPPSSGGAAAMCRELHVPLLGRLPLDPAVRVCGDEGKPLTAFGSPLVQALRGVARMLTDGLPEPEPESDDDDADAAPVAGSRAEPMVV